MAIHLIYWYQVITSMSDEHNDDTNAEGHKTIQRVVVGESLFVYVESLYTGR